MNSRPSELMLDLLKELALLKQLDEHHLGSPTSELGNAEYDARRLRRKEISDRIRALGKPSE
jgi:hypothetical protein